MVAAIVKAFNGYLNISKVSKCILKPVVILRKKIDKKIRNLENIVREFINLLVQLIICIFFHPVISKARPK